MKSFILVISLIFSFGASANDGGISYIEVLGVQPVVMSAEGGGILDDSIVLEGAAVKDLFSALPYNGIHGTSDLTIVSKVYTVTFSCTYENAKPAGQSDFTPESKCSITLTKTGLAELLANSELADITDMSDYVQNGVFSPNSIYGSGRLASNSYNMDWMVYESGRLDGLSIPNGVLFRVYGKNAFVLNNIFNGQVRFNSANGSLDISCVKNYIRPIASQEKRSDYMCTFQGYSTTAK